jgi:DnaJ-class molecular chaperone
MSCSHADNHYDILGVKRTASKTDVDKAFRRISEATESLASTAANRDYLAAVIAHAVLADAQERQKYDQNSMQEDSDIPASSSSCAVSQHYADHPDSIQQRTCSRSNSSNSSSKTLLAATAAATEQQQQQPQL